MEKSAIQWLGAPCCLRGSFAFYKGFSCPRDALKEPETWKVGEFYFVRCSPKEPVCIAEIALLWEDQEQHYPLASCRLYFLPEDTPKGRSREHGEDEVLAASKKIVVRVEDLVKWSCSEPDTFKKEKTANSVEKQLIEETKRQQETLDQNQGLDPQDHLSVKVLSYPQYCRFRSLKKRLQNVAHFPDLRDPKLLALGGLRVPNQNTRILYCRDTFNHPTLESNASIWTEFACSPLGLKGRPRKRRGRDGKSLESHHFGQSEAWIERMKENVTGSVEVQSEWLPLPEEQQFLDQLHRFMEKRNTPICKIPHLGFKKIDLFLLFSVVKKMGGYETVTAQRLWKQVYNELGGSPGSTSAATCTRRHYEKLILPYDRHLKGEDLPAVDSKPLNGPSGEVKEKNVMRHDGELSQRAMQTSSAIPDKPSEIKRESPAEMRSNRRARQLKGRNKTASSEVPANSKLIQEVKVKHTPAKPVNCGLPALSPEGSNIQEQQLGSGPALGLLTVGLKDGFIPPLTALQKLHSAATLRGFSLPQGLSPLEVLKSRLGLGTSEGSSPANHDQRKSLSQSPQPSLFLLQPNLSTNESKQKLSLDANSHTASKATETGCQNPSHKSPLPDGRPRLPMTPLRIIPLDIDCSFQVHQIMRTSLGAAQLSCFTKKLSEALAQDLSKGQCAGEAVSVSQEQTLPLNLSKKSPLKRPVDGTEPRPSSAYSSGTNFTSCVHPLHTSQPYQGSASKKSKKEITQDDQEPIRPNGRLVPPSTNIPDADEQPADLTCPNRVRAAIQEEKMMKSSMECVAKTTPDRPILNLSQSAHSHSKGSEATVMDMPSKSFKFGLVADGTHEKVSWVDSSKLCTMRHYSSRPSHAQGKVITVPEEKQMLIDDHGGPAVYPLYCFRARHVPLNELDGDHSSPRASAIVSMPGTSPGILHAQKPWTVPPHGH
ncbi:AT-rich interactive domain-containing protein 5B [Erpetoichthys calabaricus]|uniref:Zgc:77151 n=1 Tax=Erpetoichthys calabaricus TaxID=27687 RepID=A0A8C4SEN6_ERPCA|nr:AT-rich interactive domain-containing protein 5B [Erpetoichthys calabaricus]